MQSTSITHAITRLLAIILILLPDKIALNQLRCPHKNDIKTKKTPVVKDGRDIPQQRAFVSLDAYDGYQLKPVVIDKFKNILKSAVIILCTVTDNKISFAVGVTDNLTTIIDAGAIAKVLGEKVGGKGGGRKNMAMAGGTIIKKIPEAMSLIQGNLKK